MKWWVYLMRCADNTLYCGITTDLARREQEHNTSKNGASYTRARRPVTLVWHEPAETKSEALKREAEIKSFTKEQKEALVKTMNPPSSHERVEDQVQIVPFSGDALESEDSNVRMLWDSLEMVRAMGKTPLLWKLSPALLKSVATYLKTPEDKVSLGCFWNIPVDTSSHNGAIIVEWEALPLLRSV